MQLPGLRSIGRAFLMSIGFWCPISLLMGLQYKPLDPHHLWSSFVDLLFQGMIHAFALALWSPPIFYLVGKYLSFSTNRFRYVSLWALGAIPFIFLHTGIFWLITPPYDAGLHRHVWPSILSWLEMIRTGFADDTFIYIANVVGGHAYEYLKRVRRQEAERYEYQQALAASELQALKMQLQPHFLFNTLHGIATLIDGDAKSAKAMILKLSNLLRTSLDRGNSDLIPLDTELKFVREYLDLEKMRFGKRLRIEWRIEPGTANLLVPQMILQPLVENAIRHGAATSREGGWVEVEANRANGFLKINVYNSPGIKRHNGSGLGLKSVEARLRYLFRQDASVELRIAEDHTATASVVLPALDPRSGTELNIRPGFEGENSSCAFSSSTTNL